MHAVPPLQAWPVTALRAALAPLLPGFEIEVLADIDSTNSELMRRARQGQSAPLLLLAERQHAGRGRMGRVWHSHTDPQGEARAPASLTFSLGLAVQRRELSGLSLAVGLAIAQALHPAIGLKWPNDLWWQGRKLGGILIETASLGAQRYCVIGIGLNLLAPNAADLRNPAAGLRELLPELDATALLTRLAAPLVHALLAFETQGFAPLQAAYSRRDVLQGQALRCSDGREGSGAGVDARGALLLHTARGVEAVLSDEVSVRTSPDTSASDPAQG